VVGVALCGRRKLVSKREGLRSLGRVAERAKRVMRMVCRREEGQVVPRR
jgi:hypothetical protein